MNMVQVSVVHSASYHNTTCPMNPAGSDKLGETDPDSSTFVWQNCCRELLQGCMLT